MVEDKPLLEINDLRVSFEVYEGLSRVLDGVSLSIYQKERVGIAGETGCGKSITMKATMGLLKSPPAVIEGEILLQGQNLLELSNREMNNIKGTRIAIVFQDPMTSLNPVFSVGQQLFDVIRFARRSDSGSKSRRGKWSKREIRKEALSILEMVNLPDPSRILDSYPIELSGGMRQRVLIAMGLVNQPSLLIADEPGTALDVTIQDQILNLLDELVDRTNVAVSLITHNLGVLRERANRIYIMYAGQIVEFGRIEKIFHEPKHPYLQKLLDSVPRFTGGEIAEGIPGTIPAYTSPPSGCRFNPRCPHKMDVCDNEKPSLEKMGEEHYVACHLYTEAGGKDEPAVT